MGDFGATHQDLAIKNELNQKINVELDKLDVLISDRVSDFEEAFNKVQRNY